jgi:hypothetical protein
MAPHTELYTKFVANSCEYNVVVTKNPKVLDDHVQTGKKFVPPFIHKLGSNLQEISWINQGIPEFIWIAILIHKYGIKKGVELSSELSKSAVEILGKSSWCALFSTFTNITNEQQLYLISKLEQKGVLEDIKDAIYLFNANYPKSPLVFITKDMSSTKEQSNEFLSVMKALMAPLYDKFTSEAIFVQATAIYIAFITDKLKVSAGMIGSDFLAIEAYPRTEDSKKVAAFVRSSINGFLGMYTSNASTIWQNYFWAEGFKLQSCEVAYE